MNTPIYDFLQSYVNKNTARFHMPGHKGQDFLGVEQVDITEISGADALFAADGIIAESERNATNIFGTSGTFFCTEGSTQCIKAMLHLALANRGEKVGKTVVAARNCHKAFVSAAGLLDLNVQWIYGKDNSSIYSCNITADEVEQALKNREELPFAVYITSPDYPGNILPISDIAAVCQKYGVPLLVDNAHGAYLKFLSGKNHPTQLGAAMCCDSAHKTLPSLTGSAYLHIADKRFLDGAKSALSLFCSTSPSYLTLCSLDLLNAYLCQNFENRLAKCVARVEKIRSKFSIFEGKEPLKLTINAQKIEKNGEKIAIFLKNHGIECEFFDNFFVVLMVSTENSEEDFLRLENTLKKLMSVSSLPKNDRKAQPLGKIPTPSVRMSIREALFSKSESVPVEKALGRICAESAISCPPAVPVVICGEEVLPQHIEVLKTQGIAAIRVVL